MTAKPLQALKAFLKVQLLMTPQFRRLWSCWYTNTRLCSEEAYIF